MPAKCFALPYDLMTLSLELKSNFHLWTLSIQVQSEDSTFVSYDKVNGKQLWNNLEMWKNQVILGIIKLCARINIFKQKTAISIIYKKALKFSSAEANMGERGNPMV